MIQGTGIELLSRWQSFYTIMGTAAATLTGLMFLVITLVAGLETQTAALDVGISAFNTPTVVHFGAVLLIAGLLSAPWQSFASVGLLLGLASLGMVIYLLVVMRQMRRVPGYAVPWTDWLWYMALPLGAYLILMVFALALPAQPALALYLIAAAQALLLFIGIHNAWDLVIFFTVKRIRPK
jgi:hypothetical protein